MTPSRVAAASFLFAVIVLATLATTTSWPSAIVVAVAGVLGIAVGVVTGVPIVVVLGGGALLAAASLVVGRGDQHGGVMIVVVAPALWCSVEAGLRSIELRPAVRMSARAQATWIASTVAVALCTIALGLVLDGLVDAVPAGGLTFRVLSVVAVLAAGIVIAVVNVSWSRRADVPAPGTGSGVPGARTDQKRAR